MRVLVLGAGVIGVTTAYMLAARGHQVTVLERNPESAGECSYANGGQLSYSHAEPWANPQLLPKIPKWLLDPDSPLVFRPSLNMEMYRWIKDFLRCCTHKKVEESSTHMLRLALYSREKMLGLLKEQPVAFDYQQKGILHVFYTKDMLESNLTQAKWQEERGCPYQLIEGREACEAIEPALKTTPGDIAGGILFPIDGSGDIHKFTQALAKKAEKLGVKFLYDTAITSVHSEGDKVTAVRTEDGAIHTADAYVLAMGAYSPLLAKQLKIRLPIYPMKGYSISIPVTDEASAPSISMTDQRNKIVYSRLGNKVRVAGTAEFAGYNHHIRPQRIATLKRMVKQLFPECGDFDAATEWACLRPQTPDGSPVLGNSSYRNLFFNTGQGTLGWTLAAGSATVVADCVEGKKPEVNLTGLNYTRLVA